MGDARKMSPVMSAALKLIDNVRDMIIRGDCSDEDLSDALVRFHPSSHDEYIRPDDYCSYDEALRILGLGYNRNKLNDLCKKYNVVNHKCKGFPLGFLKKDIMYLREKI